MKKTIISAFFIIIFSALKAQIPTVKPSTVGLEKNYQNFSSKKETVVQKEIIKLGDFKDLHFQKIVLKDLSDDSSLSVLGIMTLSETFDNISRKTITLEKDEVEKLINALEKIQQNSSFKPENDTKYKYTTKSNIETGSNYHAEVKTWEYYLKLPATFYSQNEIQFSQNGLVELIKFLKTAHQKL